MNIKTSLRDDITIVYLEGRFDAYSAPDVNTSLEKIIDGNDLPNLVVNLQDVIFVDSTALATLVQAMKRCRQKKGDLRLSNLKQPVRMIFELTRLDRAFEIHTTEDDAKAAYAPTED